MLLTSRFPPGSPNSSLVFSGEVSCGAEACSLGWGQVRGLKGSRTPVLFVYKALTTCTIFSSAKKVSFAHSFIYSTNISRRPLWIINTFRIYEQCTKPAKLPALMKLVFSSGERVHEQMHNISDEISHVRGKQHIIRW